MRPGALLRNSRNKEGVAMEIRTVQHAAKQPRAKPRISPLEEAWKTAVLRVRLPLTALLLWERVLSDDDRRRLGGDLDAALKRYNAAGMWMFLRGVSHERAVVEVARALNLIDAPT